MIIIILIIIILIMYWSWYMVLNSPILPCVKIEDMVFKTGDIILFHAYNNMNSMFIGSYWGHIGIVYVDPKTPDTPYIFEAARTSKMKNCPDYNKHGIMITKIKTRIKKYPGLIACKSLNSPVDKNNNIGFKEFIIYAKNHMYYNENIFMSGIQKKMGAAFTNGTNCGELVFMSLIKLGLLPESMFTEKILHHLFYTANLTNVENNFYHDPVEITISPF